VNPLIQLAIAELPTVIAAFKELFKKNNPDLPEPTSDEVIATFNQVYILSLAKDDAWDAAHPKA